MGVFRIFFVGEYLVGRLFILGNNGVFVGGGKTYGLVSSYCNFTIFRDMFCNGTSYTIITIWVVVVGVVGVFIFGTSMVDNNFFTYFVKGNFFIGHGGLFCVFELHGYMEVVFI